MAAATLVESSLASLPSSHTNNYVHIALSEKMHADGFINLTNIDYSETIIDEMRARTAHLIPPQEWLVMDMRRLLLPSESFEIVLDKASLDAIWTDGGSVWDPSKALRNDIKAVVDEVLRVLKPGGKFISISFGQPHFRKPLMERSEQWSLEVNPIDDTFYFLYIFTKY